MNQGFLAQESKKAHRKNRRLFTILLIIYLTLLAIIVFMVKDKIDFSDYDTKKVVVCISVLSVIMLVSVVTGLISTILGTTDGKSLILPFQENTKKAVGEIIDREVAEGNVLVDEYIEKFTDEKIPYGERVMLIPSYLLLFNSMGRVFAIPREKIYWLCAQAGIKGRSPFAVRLLIFTEKKTFNFMEGMDVGHVEEIADKLYQYIPNVFSNYDPFSLSYELDKLFDKDREEFVKFYENEKKKQGAI